MATVNGFQLRDAIKRWELRRDTLVAQFNASLAKFPGEEKPAPTALSEQIVDAERAIADLQTAQLLYNATVKIQVGSTSMSIAAAVKNVGGANRMEKLWKTALGTLSGAAAARSPYYTGASHERNKDIVVATATMTVTDAMDRATKAAAWSSTLRGAVAAGNAFAMSMDLDERLLRE